MFTTKRAQGILALIFLAFGFGLIAVTLRYISYEFQLFQQLYITNGIAFLLSFFIFPRTLTWKRIKNIPKSDLYWVVFRVFIGSLIGMSLYRTSLLLTKISNVAFLQSIPFDAVFGFLLFRERFNTKKLVFLAIVFIGVILISVQDFTNIWHFGLGELFSLFSSALFALGFLARKWQSNYLNNKELTQILLGLSTFILLMVSMVKGEGWPIFSGNLLIYLAVLASSLIAILNVLLINFGFNHVKAVMASTILSMEGLFATILALLIYKEVPEPKALLGGVFIVLGVVLMARTDSEEHKIGNFIPPAT